jgi:hypothetical protein
MGFADVIWAASIVAGAIYILYRSLWKKKGHCTGCCSSETCSMKKR